MSRRLTAFGVVVVVWCICQALVEPSRTFARPTVVAIRVALAEAATDTVDANTLRTLNDSMHDNLSQQRGVQLVSREQADFVIWGAVTHLSNRVQQGEREVDCNVSVIVAEARGGSIRFTLAGRAVARGDVRSNALTNEAMTAAVRGALTPLSRGLSAVHGR